MIYASIDDLKNYIPASIPNSIKEKYPENTEIHWNSFLENLLTQQSTVVTERLGCSFALYPNTPQTVQEICVYLSAAKVYLIHGGTYLNTENKTISTYNARANKLIDEIKQGKINIDAIGSTITVAVELPTGKVTEEAESLW